MKDEDPDDCGGLSFKQLVACFVVMTVLILGCFELGKFVRRQTAGKNAGESTTLYPEWKRAADAEAKRRESEQISKEAEATSAHETIPQQQSKDIQSP